MNYRICVFGNSASGKSTLAKALGEKLGIPVYHLDKHLLHGNYQKYPLEIRDKIMTDLTDQENWVIDGSYHKSLESRLQRATHAVFIDIGRAKVIYRLVKRSRNSKDPVYRNSIPQEANPEMISWPFLKFVLSYSRKKRSNFLKEQFSKREIDLIKIKSKNIQKMVEEILAKIA